eukprot:g5685.t1
MNQEQDGIDLRMKTLGDKLKDAGYATHLIGKTHWGVATDLHLPVNRGFEEAVGYLGGAAAYSTGHECVKETVNCDNYTSQLDMWHNDRPAEDEYLNKYSTTMYTDLAVAAIHNHRSRYGAFAGSKRPDAPKQQQQNAKQQQSSLLTKPLWLHLNYQAIHNPQTSPPGMSHCDDDESKVLYQVLEAMDAGIARVVAALKESEMYENTLIVCASDNGAADHGNNFPLRGGKYSPFEGGVRLAAAIGGGLLPKSLRGAAWDEIVHVADVYPTLATLAGVSPADDPPSDDPQEWFWPVDGRNFWPSLTQGKPSPWTGKPLVISGPVTSGPGGGALVWDNFKLVNNASNSAWDQPANTKTSSPSLPGNSTCVTGSGRACKICTVLKPCLYDVVKDQSEVRNLASEMPDVLKKLNDSYRALVFERRMPDKLNFTKENGWECDPTIEPSPYPPLPPGTWTCKGKRYGCYVGPECVCADKKKPCAVH